MLTLLSLDSSFIDCGIRPCGDDTRDITWLIWLAWLLQILFYISSETKSSQDQCSSDNPSNHTLTVLFGMICGLYLNLMILNIFVLAISLQLIARTPKETGIKTQLTGYCGLIFILTNAFSTMSSRGFMLACLILAFFALIEYFLAHRRIHLPTLISCVVIAALTFHEVNDRAIQITAESANLATESANLAIESATLKNVMTRLLDPYTHASLLTVSQADCSPSEITLYMLNIINPLVNPDSDLQQVCFQSASKHYGIYDLDLTAFTSAIGILHPTHLTILGLICTTIIGTIFLVRQFQLSWGAKATIVILITRFGLIDWILSLCLLVLVLGASKIHRNYLSNYATKR